MAESLDKCDLFLSSDILPPEWNDNERLDVLFAPFRNRIVNPQDWDSKLSFWKKLIEAHCLYKNIFTFNEDFLLKLFNKDGRSPSCFPVVIQELLKSGELRTLDDYMDKSTATWTGWAMNLLVKKPLYWSLNKIKESVTRTTSKDKNIEYVHLPTVTVKAHELLKLLTENHKKLIPLNEIYSLVKYKNVDILIQYLLLNKYACIKEIKDNKSTTLILKYQNISPVLPISDYEIDVYRLEQAEQVLSEKLKNLENEVVQIIAEAKINLSKGYKQMAKSCLRKKQVLQKRILKIYDTLHNVQGLLSALEDSKENGEIVDSYKAALKTLRLSYENGMSEDEVISTMVELSEVMEIHNNVQDSLAQPLSEDTESDFEKELSDLMSGESLEFNQNMNEELDPISNKLNAIDLHLPDVPLSEKSPSSVQI